MNSNVGDTLMVVLDVNFGDKLREIWPGNPVWITSSPRNDPVIKDLIEKNPNEHYLRGLNTMTLYNEKPASERFLYYLETIEQHQGFDSTNTPYRTMMVFGSPLSMGINQELEGIGLKKVKEDTDYFEFKRI